MNARRPAETSAGSDIESELVEVRLGISRLQRLLSSRRINAGMADAAGVDLSQQSVEVLRALGSNDPMPVGELARAARMDTGAVSRQLRTLTDLGLVERRASEHHGSIVLVVGTPAGRALAARYERVRSAQLSRALAEWEPEERIELGRLLLRLVDDLQSTPYLELDGD
ncbi:MAG: MarR family winged helix-turn-helix transcriptional regulator [Acidimicrobiia bacterium]